VTDRKSPRGTSLRAALAPLAEVWLAVSSKIGESLTSLFRGVLHALNDALIFLVGEIAKPCYDLFRAVFGDVNELMRAVWGIVDAIFEYHAKVAVLFASFLRSTEFRLRCVLRLSGGIAGVAARLAGRRHASNADSWRADLYRDPEDGPALPARTVIRHAAGFIVAALKLRLRDVGRILATPLDWMVTTDVRLHAAIVTPVVCTMISLFHAGGFARLWGELEQVGVVAGFATALSYGWRRLRRIEPKRAERSPTGTEE
jgi:hypothetical protein